MQKYNITCHDCGATRQVGIIDGHMGQIVDWLDNNPDPQIVKIVSARKRFDDQWGWQCICGNDDMWTEQESKFVSNKSNPKPTEIADIMNSLTPVESKFRMVAV